MTYLKPTIIALLSFLTVAISAQSEPGEDKTSEVKVNALYLILGGFEIDYEHILNEESSLGASLTFFFDNDSQYKWGFTPHYRLFFGKQPALGFFVEGHATVFGWEPYVYDDFFGGREKRTTGGIGIAIGGKFKTTRDVVVEVNGGLGRIFDNDNVDSVYPRFGINIGKRF